MFTIENGEAMARALSAPIDPLVKQLLIERRNQLGGDIKDKARFLIPGQNDSVETLEKALGFPGLSDPEGSFGCEWLADHSAVYEVVWILSDDGFAHVTLVSKQKGMDRRLIDLCADLVTERV